MSITTRLVTPRNTVRSVLTVTSKHINWSLMSVPVQLTVRIRSSTMKLKSFLGKIYRQLHAHSIDTCKPMVYPSFTREKF